MARKKLPVNRLNGAASIKTIEDDEEVGTQTSVEESDDTTQDEPIHNEANEKHEKKGKPDRKAKAKPEPQSDNFGVAEIRKSAAFVNSVGGLDKAITLLQILKVAKEVQ